MVSSSIINTLDNLQNGISNFRGSQSSTTWLICVLVSCIYCFATNSNRKYMLGCFLYQFFISLIVLILLFSFPDLDLFNLANKKSNFIPNNSILNKIIYKKKVKPVEIY